MENRKVCNVCKQHKLHIEFCKNKASKDGLNYKCNNCNKLARIKYLVNNKDKELKRHKLYKLNNKEKIKKNDKLYRLNNKHKEYGRQKIWRKNNPQKVKDKGKRARMKTDKSKFKNLSLLYKFGISLHEFELMVKKQSNLCAICNSQETLFDKRANKIRSLVVDHDHRSGKIRGLLCGACNKGLGLFKDNSEIIKKASEYLKL